MTPAAAARSTAAAVGADSAISSGAPIRAAYGTRWTDTRLVITTAPDPGARLRALAARDGAVAEELVEAAHPVAVIVNQAPDAPPGSWLGPVGQLSERSSVPVLRCSVASPSWLQRATGLDDCLTKPVSREALRGMVERYLEEPGAVLVVDDNPGFVSLVQRMLAAMPRVREVFTAYSGSEGLRVARERHPQLVLLDLLMPELDGFDVLQELRGDPSLEKTRVVAVTATSYAEEVLLREGGHFTVSKPGGLSAAETVELLRATIRSLHPEYLRGEESTSASA